jgi:hypothetical protein
MNERAVVGVNAKTKVTIIKPFLRDKEAIPKKRKIAI